MCAGINESAPAGSDPVGGHPVELDLLRTRKESGAPALVSACLAGRRCRYDGTDCRDERIVQMVEAGQALPVCPELFVGLPIPRPPAEIVGGDGADVLAGRARVVQQSGNDITEQVVKGAHKVVAAAVEAHATRAILKSKSPSCGPGEIYDGTFTGATRGGMGVTAALLAQHGIKVESSEDYSVDE